jgi:hypothetical protein
MLQDNVALKLVLYIKPLLEITDAGERDSTVRIAKVYLSPFIEIFLIEK